MSAGFTEDEIKSFRPSGSVAATLGRSLVESNKLADDLVVLLSVDHCRLFFSGEGSKGYFDKTVGTQNQTVPDCRKLL